MKKKTKKKQQHWLFEIWETKTFSLQALQNDW